MESLVVTLDTAKKLKAAGFPQDTQWFWSVEPQGTRLIVNPADAYDEDFVRAAPTAQELADQLPPDVLMQRLSIAGQWLASHVGDDWKMNGAYSGKADTMAEALAQLWLKLHGVQQ